MKLACEPQALHKCCSGCGREFVNGDRKVQKLQTPSRTVAIAPSGSPPLTGPLRNSAAVGHFLSCLPTALLVSEGFARAPPDRSSNAAALLQASIAAAATGTPDQKFAHTRWTCVTAWAVAVAVRTPSPMLTCGWALRHRQGMQTALNRQLCLILMACMHERLAATL